MLARQLRRTSRAGRPAAALSRHQSPFVLSLSKYGRTLPLLLAALALLTVLLVSAPPAQAQSSVPSAPAIDEFYRIHTGYVLYWCDVADCGSRDTSVTKYDVQYKLTTASSWTSATSVTGTPPLQATRITGLTTGSTYDVRIRAVNANGNSAWTSETASSAVYVQPNLPDSPFNPTAAPGPGSLALSWTAPAHTGGRTINSYVIQINPVGESATTIRTPTAATSYTVTGLMGGTEYEILISAGFGTNQRGWATHYVSGTPQADPLSVGDCDRVNNTATPPTNPAITGATVSGTSVTLSWNPPANSHGHPVTNYVVYVYKADETLRSARAWDFKGHENAATTYTETLTGLAANTAYEARVRARTILGCRSGFSAVQSFTTGAGGL